MTRDELKEKINKAKFAYYNTDNPIISDKEYDNLIKKYGEEPSVGAPVLNSIKKIKIVDKPMLSLDKVHNEKEIISFSNGYDIVASIKCDGLSVRLIYKNGMLFSANTRGNGSEGADITEHIKYFTNVPLKILKTEKYIIDGEAIIYDDDFKIINKNNQFKNSRNTASGSLALLDMNIVKQRRLSFIAWDIIQGGCSSECYHYNMEEAEKLGFTTVPMLILDATKIEQEEIANINQTLLKESKEKGIPYDGIVWRINDIKEGSRRGQTAHHFLNAIAWKPADEMYETRLKYIDWTMGRTGVLTPVAVFEPVDIDGSIVERASLHNVSVMRDVLGDCSYVGESLRVAKMNMIIPQVLEAGPKMTYEEILKHGRIKALDEISICPICGGKVSITPSDNGILNAICQNPSCEGKLINRLDHFCGKKGLDIKGISKATLNKLIDWGWVESPIDIFTLCLHKSEWVKKAGFGIASVNKILNSIEEHKKTTLAAFISSLGIPLIGVSVAKILAETFDTYEDFRKAVDNKEYSFALLTGFGPEMNSALKSFDFTEADSIVPFLSIETKKITKEESITNKKLKDKVVVITGKLITFKNRNELKEIILKNGGKVTDSITSKTSLLINNDINSTSSKNKAAKSKGIPIISETDFIQSYLEN